MGVIAHTSKGGVRPGEANRGGAGSEKQGLSIGGGIGASTAAVTGESRHKKRQALACGARPSVVVLLPTSELVAQVARVAKSLGHVSKFCAVGLDHTIGKCRQQLKRPVDLLVSTPGRLAALRQSEHVYLSCVKHLVIDEADTLLDDSFLPDVQSHIAACKESYLPDGWSKAHHGRDAQLVVVAATAKTYQYNKLFEMVPCLRMVQSDRVRHDTCPDSRCLFRHDTCLDSRCLFL